MHQTQIRITSPQSYRHLRLKSRKRIGHLFASGRRVKQGSLLLVWLSAEDADIEQSATITFGVSVSKRFFKRAVDRNLLKRRIREAYRLQKDEIFKHHISDNSYDIFVVYTGRGIAKYDIIAKDMSRLLEKWMKQITP